ncbi:hypothetical protein HDU96_009910 [Phlyctochytrium bullatum]|nr:hypothetical protein HDU96_009910 [Phlyctochytrium bullatum]
MADHVENLLATENQHQNDAVLAGMLDTKRHIDIGDAESAQNEVSVVKRSDLVLDDHNCDNVMDEARIPTTQILPVPAPRLAELVPAVVSAAGLDDKNISPLTAIHHVTNPRLDSDATVAEACANAVPAVEMDGSNKSGRKWRKGLRKAFKKARQAFRKIFGACLLAAGEEITRCDLMA